MQAYHFTADKLRDGSPIPAIGEWLEYRGKIELCKLGLHYSRHPFDALKYAQGDLMHLVEVEKVAYRNYDKGVCRRRKIIATLNADNCEALLREFARKCALDVIHLWNIPPVVRVYLESGDERLRIAARSALSDAAWAASARGIDAVTLTVWCAAWATTADNGWAAVAAVSSLVGIGAAATASAAAVSKADRDATVAAVIKKQRVRFKRMVETAFAKMAVKG